MLLKAMNMILIVLLRTSAKLCQWCNKSTFDKRCTELLEILIADNIVTNIEYIILFNVSAHS